MVQVNQEVLNRCAVIGDPAHHSLSPAIHRAGYIACELNWRYDAITVSPTDLDDFVRSCANNADWVGLSVTAPHKQAILAHGEPDEVARLGGGGNTLLFGATPRVYNTDISGFVRAWRARCGGAAIRCAGVIGSGATARSLVVALAGLDAREIVILARDPRRASTLVDLGTELGMSAHAASLDEAVDGLDLLASTIPAAATKDFATAWVKTAQVVFDVVYDPWPTPLGTAAAIRGVVALSGLDLLAGQAVDQFRLFTGRTMTFEQCRDAAERELHSRQSLTQ